MPNPDGIHSTFALNPKVDKDSPPLPPSAYLSNSYEAFSHNLENIAA